MLVRGRAFFASACGGVATRLLQRVILCSVVEFTAPAYPYFFLISAAYCTDVLLLWTS